MKNFSTTTAGQNSKRIARELAGVGVDELGLTQRRELLQMVSDEDGKEALIDIIISMLPFELRMAASDAYDEACRTHH